MHVKESARRKQSELNFAANRFRVSAEAADAWQALSALQPGDGRLCCSHFTGHFRLTQTGPVAGGDQLPRDGELGFQGSIGPAKFRIAQPSFLELL